MLSSITCSWHIATEVTGSNKAFAPPARAPEASRASIPLCARCTATNEDEHAVSVLMQGPAAVWQAIDTLTACLQTSSQMLQPDTSMGVIV
jgi:hypothetical protein